MQIGGTATVLGVIVKDGEDGTNFYDYSPTGSTGDNYLPTPNNGAKGISHISFCYEVRPSTNTPTNTATNTATSTPTNTLTDTLTNTPTFAEVIADVNAALATNNRSTMLNLAAQLDAYNNLGCLLD